MDYFNLGLAFLEGLALVFSPCILPILPIILSSAASTENTKAKYRRPFGVVAGFVFAFAGFALLSRKLVTLVGLNTELVRIGSLALLFFFGLILISSKLSERFSRLTQSLAGFGTKLSQSQAQDESFLSAFLLGCLIGLVWTPCAGPILAAAIVQTIRQETDLSGFLTIVSFSLGAGIPMLAIAIAGKGLMDRLGFFKQNSEIIRKVFGFLVLGAVAFIALGGQALLPGKDPSSQNSFAGKKELIGKLANPYPAPELEGLQAWINSKPLQISDLKGKVVLIDFWTYSCINCQRTLPYLKNWDEKYREHGLLIIGIHAPEFEFEKTLTNVQKAVKDRGLRYPVALDNQLQTWTNYKNRYWPAHYLIDKSGTVVYEHFGEGAYAETENNIRFLLGLSPQKPEDSAAVKPKKAQKQTPETYLGYARSKAFASPEALEKETSKAYSLPSELPENAWALSGQWKIQADRISAVEPNAKLKINFHAKKVFLVLGKNTTNPNGVKLKLNGQPLGKAAGEDVKNDRVIVDSHRLYELIDFKESSESGLLELEAEGSGLEAYAFTFGS